MTDESEDPDVGLIGARLTAGHTFIQWKGTEVCIDITCECGESMHLDTGFLYAFECPGCRKTFVVGTRVQIGEAPPDYTGVVVRRNSPPDSEFDDGHWVVG